MVRFWKFLANQWRGSAPHEGAEPDTAELRRTFQVRYHHFKLLLNANNKALEVMSDIERALHGPHPFGMAFVRSACTAVSVNVLQIIRNLEQLAPGRNKGLMTSFERIQANINVTLSASPPRGGSRLVIPLPETGEAVADEVGNKMANLGEIRMTQGVLVPGGFAVTATAYRRFMDHNDLQTEIDRLIQAANAERPEQLYALSANLQQLIIRSTVPTDVVDAIQEAYAELERELGNDVKVSMRSSALGEDMATVSFAGQYKSELNVSRDSLIHVYKEIVASKYNFSSMTYRLARGLRDEDVAMCVGCMAMVDAIAGGVIYSRDPISSSIDSVLISSAWGLAKSVVDGSTTSDLFVVSRSGPMAITKKAIQPKLHRMVSLPDEGLIREDLSEEDSGRPSIDDATVLSLAAMAVRLEDRYGSPQDVEWAMTADRRIFVLQCRPIQIMGASMEGVDGLSVPECTAGALLRGGITASPGAACGPVFVARRNADILRFTEGAVLAVAQPSPAWASLLSRAAAVIAEQGSVAGHLASVARELGLPALFGLEGALSVVKEGALVTVDADGRKVLEGRVEALVSRGPVRKDLIKGSPVFETLSRAAEHIVPLNLLDPDSADFRSGSCRTYHDITRFSHEKAVAEMFHFGKDHHFSERSSKQLVCDVPMQLWVINLGDGFRDEAHGKFVQLDNIVSIPMRALWDGMRAVPWQGPPPVHAKGFMSVMFEATANPALDPAMGGRFSDRNYFMVSRNFCSLQSRFGFHFSTVEALVSERALENYVSFSFKGGATDYERRRGRVELVGGLLTDFGFRVEIRRDGLTARVEGYEQDHMEERLRVLGYMIVHTRQIDIIMSDPAATARCRAKMAEDLRGLTPP